MVIAEWFSPNQIYFSLKYNVDRGDVIACYVMQIWLITDYRAFWNL